MAELRVSPRASARRWVALALGAGLLVGCPNKTTTEPPPPPPALSPGPQGPAGGQPVVVAPQPGADPDKVVPPAPKPKGQAEAWEAAATKQTNWRIGLAKACKQEAERKALLGPFQEPSSELVRLVAFARAFPCYDAGLSHAARLDHRLKRLYTEDAFLASTPIKVESTAAGALLLLADAKVMGQARFVLTKSGWQSPRQGLADKSYPGARAKALLAGIELARDGRWEEATPALLAALRAEGAAVSQASGDAFTERAWASLVEVLDSPDATLESFNTALERWSGAFLRKGLEGAVTKNKKR